MVQTVLKKEMQYSHVRITHRQASCQNETITAKTFPSLQMMLVLETAVCHQQEQTFKGSERSR